MKTHTFLHKCIRYTHLQTHTCTHTHTVQAHINTATICTYTNTNACPHSLSLSLIDLNTHTHHHLPCKTPVNHCTTLVVRASVVKSSWGSSLCRSLSIPVVKVWAFSHFVKYRHVKLMIASTAIIKYPLMLQLGGLTQMTTPVPNLTITLQTKSM